MENSIIINIEGEDFQTFAGQFKKPFDALFTEAMHKTLKALCETLPGCVLGYANGFEFTLILTENPWPDMTFEKAATLAASKATLVFNRIFSEAAKYVTMGVDSFDKTTTLTEMSGYINAMDQGTLFFAEVDSVPFDQVFECLYHKQKKALERALHQVGSLYFEQTELEGKNAGEIQFMIFEKAGVNFEDYPAENRRGVACIRNFRDETGMFSEFHPEDEWLIDRDMPMLKEENKQYVERWLK